MAHSIPTRLALDGGKPLRKVPFAPWPYFSHEEIEAATRVLESGKVNYWTGEEGRRFEEEFAAYTGCKHAVGLANGTVALELALRVLGIGPGDEVIVPSRTFIASVSCVFMCGAIPVVADVESDSQTITANAIRAVLSPRTRAVIAVHLAGWPCDMDPILELAREHRLKIVEDCAQAHGAAYKGRRVGSMGDANAFSFCQDKIMSTGGEGGMLTTNDPELWTRAWSFKDHGKSFDATHRQNHSPGYQWVHKSVGTNWRLTEMQSAIGRRLLRKLPQFVEKRQILAGLLSESLSKMAALRVVTPPDHLTHSFYKYYVFLRRGQLWDGWNRQRIVDAVNAEGVPCFVGSCSEIYLERMFPAKLRPSPRLPVARILGETALMFLVHPTLDASDMKDTAAALEKVLSRASR
jgi:dTDP-4-amino-4,6-dideoxygalactose transaminase